MKKGCFLTAALLSFMTCAENFNSSEQFSLSYKVDDRSIEWIYANCGEIETALYFSDYSETIERLINTDITNALGFFTNLLKNKAGPDSLVTFPFSFKGNLVFVIETLVENQSSFTVVKHSTTERYFCEFKDFPTLEIMKKNSDLMFVGKNTFYQVFEHGDVLNQKGLIGELASFLCNSEFGTGKWISSCKDPAEIVGRKIAAGQHSCVLQGRTIQQNITKHGKCVFGENKNSEFLVFVNDVTQTKVSGFLQAYKSVKIQIEDKELALKTLNMLNGSYIKGEISPKSFIGTKVVVSAEDSKSECVIGDFPIKSIKSSSDPKHGSAFITILIIFCVSIILFIEVRSKKLSS